MIHFAPPDSLLRMVAEQKKGIPSGFYSICSANPMVIEACLRQALPEEHDILIEATCNQVNQFGGYTGMTPVDFASVIGQIAARASFPIERIILGGDHLGPNPWQGEPAETALDKSQAMVRDYVAAGFAKIHLDASMHCADDDHRYPLNPEIIAERTADLCEVAERASDEGSRVSKPVYVIGTEVPTPGGETASLDSIKVTGADEAQQTLELFRTVFKRRNLEHAWERVIGLVVQPGVDFGNTEIHEYCRECTHDLSKMIERVPGIVFEAHSTDYQRPSHLRQMVEDHFAILKVGPALTFALREAAFALASIEREWLSPRSVALSDFTRVADSVMVRNTTHWAKYYGGDEDEKALARRYSLSDRFRYYWPNPEIQDALTLLLDNLSRFPPPLALLSQYLPLQYARVREELIPNDPLHLIWDHIAEAAAHYQRACRTGQ